MAKLPKEWVANVAYSVMGDQFSDWVEEAIEERNARIAEQGNLLMDMDPEVYAAF